MSETILITGANRGIGLELVRQYTIHGARVHACCRNPEQAGALKALEVESSGRVTVHSLDVGRDEDIRRLVEALRGEAIDILLNNAGIHGPAQQGFGTIDEAGWMETFRINVVAPYKMAVAFAERVAASRRKVIATMGSLMGSVAENSSGGMYPYRSSKSAVHMVMKSLAIDLRSRGIIAVALHPGWVRTDMGGPQAPLTAAESVAGLRRVLSSLTLEDSGKLWDYQQRVLPW